MDGRIAGPRGRRWRLSGPDDLARVERLRRWADAIAVGSGTARLDNPTLSLHPEWAPELPPPTRPAPTRVLFDGRGRVSLRARLLDGSAPTVVVTTVRNRRTYPPPIERIDAGRARVDLSAALAALRDRGVRRLLVEGGATIFGSLLADSLFDRFTVYVAPIVIGDPTAPSLIRASRARLPLELLVTERVERLGPGFLVSYRRANRRSVGMPRSHPHPLSVRPIGGAGRPR